MRGRAASGDVLLFFFAMSVLSLPARGASDVRARLIWLERRRAARQVQRARIRLAAERTLVGGHSTGCTFEASTGTQGGTLACLGDIDALHATPK